MFSLRGGLIVAAATALFVPASASAQVLGGVGIGFGTQQQLGPPPAGVLLHQQYMQLYGLPTSFLQGTVNNGGGAAAIPPYGYGGGYGFGGAPRFYGANYQRNIAAMQAYQAAAMQNYYATGGYAMNPYAAPATAPGTYGSFATAGTPTQPTFGQSPTASRQTTPSFGGFGLTSTANPFLTDLKKDDKKKDEKKDDKKEDK